MYYSLAADLLHAYSFDVINRRGEGQGLDYMYYNVPAVPMARMYKIESKHVLLCYNKNIE